MHPRLVSHRYSHSTVTVRARRRGIMATLTSDQTKLLQNAAAAYTNTGGNGLVQGQVDHTIQLGKRVKATVEEMKEMEENFNSSNYGDVFQLDVCVVCARKITHGDFAIDHILYYREGDEEKRTAKVSTLLSISSH